MGEGCVIYVKPACLAPTNRRQAGIQSELSEAVSRSKASKANHNGYFAAIADNQVVLSMSNLPASRQPTGGRQGYNLNLAKRFREAKQVKQITTILRISLSVKRRRFFY